MIVTETNSPDQCTNCGAHVPDRFCGHCGQNRRQLDSTVALLRETAEEVFSLEGRTVRTLRLLLLKPGLVTAEYLAGRRQHYTPPIRLFLAASAAFFFTFLLTRSLSANYYGYERSSVDSYVDAMSTALLLMLPILALVLELLYPRSQRPFLHHLIFALYAGASGVLWMLGLTLIAAAGRSWWGHYSAAPAWLPDFVLWLYIPGMVFFCGHLALALRRVYRSSLVGSVLRALVVMLAMGALFLLATPRMLALFS